MSKLPGPASLHAQDPFAFLGLAASRGRDPFPACSQRVDVPSSGLDLALVPKFPVGSALQASAGMKGQGGAVGLGSRLGSLPCAPWGGCSRCATFSSPVTCHLGNAPPIPLWGWGHPAQCPPKGDTKGWVTTGTRWPFGVTSSPPPAHQPRSGPQWEGRGRKIGVAPLRN